MNRLILIVTVLSIGSAVSVARHAPELRARAEAAPVRYSKPNPWSKDDILAEQTPAPAPGRGLPSRSGTPVAGSGGEVRLAREADGHFYAEAMVRGVPVRAVIDTGASIVALPGEEARRIGFSWSSADVKPIGRGASGPVYGLIRHADSIAVGSLTVRDVDVMIIPEGLDVTLLGQNFLSGIRTVQMKGDEMVLSNL